MPLSKKPDQLGVPQVSIIVPILNELPNLSPLLERIFKSLYHTPWTYEVIFIDDHSSDGSLEYLQKAASVSPFAVIAEAKIGKRGKATSLLQGFTKARGQYLVMIDADLQYPPEAIPSMLEGLIKEDIIVANRKEQQVSKIRQRVSNTFKNLIGSGILGLPVDVQSGLKAFRADILAKLSLTPSPWGFDYQFLYLAKRQGFSIAEVDIVFNERIAGQSQVNILKTTLELLWGALKLRTSYVIADLFPFAHYPHKSELKGISYNNDTDFLFMPEIYSIKRHIYPENISGGIIILGTFILILLGLSALINVSIPVILSALVALFYLGLFVFKLIIVRKSLNQPGINFTPEEIAAIDDSKLPMFSIVVPLRDEAEVIPQIIAAMSAIDWPKDKLEIVITLEEYDHSTIDAIDAANPPAYFRKFILPDVKPKTKPKALNVAFPHLKGEFMVIYDAEIIPDRDQLKKAYLAFQQDPQVACLQTQLDHYNANETIVTRLFNAEFSFYYDMFLPGLQKAGSPLPLSGHSSLYRTEVIRQMGAWDPYNVTEDCELGMRLYRCGYKTEILESRSLEEATSTVSAWVGQRTRWIKGFIQTTLVHMRHPIRFKNELGGWGKFFGFIIAVPGSIAVNIINLFDFFLLLSWIITKAAAIQALFPGPVLYISVFSFLAGNFIFTYLNLIGSYRRGRYDMVKYSLLSPLYWLMLAYASVKASIEIIYKPHHWSKTRHGVHLNPKNALPVQS